MRWRYFREDRCAPVLHALALALTQRATAALAGAWRRCDPLPVRSFREAFDAFAEGFFLVAPSSMRDRGG